MARNLKTLNRTTHWRGPAPPTLCQFQCLNTSTCNKPNIQITDDGMSDNSNPTGGGEHGSRVGCLSDWHFQIRTNVACRAKSNQRSSGLHYTNALTGYNQPLDQVDSSCWELCADPDLTVVSSCKDLSKCWLRELRTWLLFELLPFASSCIYSKALGLARSVAPLDGPLLRWQMLLAILRSFWVGGAARHARLN